MSSPFAINGAAFPSLPPSREREGDKDTTIVVPLYFSGDDPNHHHLCSARRVSWVSGAGSLLQAGKKMMSRTKTLPSVVSVWSEKV